MANSSSLVGHATEPKNEGELDIHDVVISNNTRNIEVDIKVVVEMQFSQNNDNGSQEELRNFVSENKEKSFCSQASDLGVDVAKECHGLSPRTYMMEEARQFDGTGGSEMVTQPCTAEEILDSVKDRKDSSIQMSVQQTPPLITKGKRQKGKNAQESGPSSPSPIGSNSTDSSNNPGTSSSIPSVETAISQILSMQEILNHLVAMQKEMQNGCSSSYQRRQKT